MLRRCLDREYCGGRGCRTRPAEAGPDGPCEGPLAFRTRTPPTRSGPIRVRSGRGYRYRRRRSHRIRMVTGATNSSRSRRCMVDMASPGRLPDRGVAGMACPPPRNLLAFRYHTGSRRRRLRRGSPRLVLGSEACRLDRWWVFWRLDGRFLAWGAGRGSPMPRARSEGMGRP